MTETMNVFFLLFGYLSSILVFVTFYMKNMATLRVLAISSNVTSLVYTIANGIWPFAILHAALLPLNCLRLRQIHKMIAALSAARKADFDMRILYPFMQQTKFKTGDLIFF